MPVKIPQNVEREDRIVGPLTLKQLLWLVGGTVTVIAIVRYWLAGYLYTFEMVAYSIVIIILTLLFAFFRYNEQNFVGLLASALRFALTPKQLLWIKNRQEESEPAITKETMTSAKTIDQIKLEQTRSGLEKITQLLDSGGNLNKEESPDLSGRVAALPWQSSERIERVEDLDDIFAKTES